MPIWLCGACQSTYRSGGDYQIDRVTISENYDPLYWRIFGEGYECPEGGR